jgi:hypothetical protein
MFLTRSHTWVIDIYVKVVPPITLPPPPNTPELFTVLLTILAEHLFWPACLWCWWHRTAEIKLVVRHKNLPLTGQASLPAESHPVPGGVQLELGTTFRLLWGILPTLSSVTCLLSFAGGLSWWPLGFASEWLLLISCGLCCCCSSIVSSVCIVSLDPSCRTQALKPGSFTI